MTKLDESRVIRIIREKRKGTPNGKIAEEAGVSVRWGIESAYAQIEVMRAKPRSCNRGGRLFCFICSLMVFNAWVMARILLRSILIIPGLSLSRRLGTITQLALKEIIGALAGSGPGPPPGGEPGLV